jgi:hypothetical protein
MLSLTLLGMPSSVGERSGLFCTSHIFPRSWRLAVLVELRMNCLLQDM